MKTGKRATRTLACGWSIILAAALLAAVGTPASGPAAAWQWRASGAGAQALTAVVWDGARFVATTEKGETFGSPDGQTWTVLKDAAGLPSGSVAWNGTKMVALQTGKDSGQGLLPWTEAGLDAVAGVKVRAACVGGTAEDPIFVAVGEQGIVLRSPDGAGWSAENADAADLRGVAWGGPAGDKRFVAVGQGGVVLNSPDGRRWSPAIAEGGDDLNAVAWCGSRFFAVGAAGTILGSEDGLTWEPEASPVSQWLYAIAWSGTRVVAVGEYGTIAEAAPVPTVTGVSPNGGPLVGGTSVTITGAGLTGATAVAFGANPATSVVPVSDTQVTCKSPAGVAGTVDVTVTTPGGTSATNSNDKFTYYAVPTVTAISPSAGLTAGGTIVQITGTSLAPANVTVVRFGAVASTSVVYSSPTGITAVSPPQAAGAVDVTVTTPGGTSATSSADKFTYVAPVPVVLSLTPTSGPMAGGTTVTLTGSGFTAATSVLFGKIVGTKVTVVSDTSLTVTSPAQAAGTVDVTVTTAGGTSAAWSGDQFTYATPAPTVTALSPTSGPAAGGTTVTITGTNFVSGATVKFGTAAATGVAFVSATKMTAVSPAGTGVVDVTVTTSVGTSGVSAADKFTYVAAPAVASISPSTGSTAGGTAVTLTGTGFLAGASVAIGGVPCTSVVVVSAASLTAVTGAHAAGTVDVTVTNADGQSATLTGGFSYSVPPQITSVQKAQDPFRLKIYGMGFHGYCTAYINGVAVPQTKFKSGNQVNALKGDPLLGMLPKGVPVQITLKNNDDGLVSAPFTYMR